MSTSATNYTQFVEDHPDYRSGDGVATTAAVYNTLDAANNACVASQGDTVYVMTGYTETFSSATAWNLDTKGVTYIALGTGNDRATLTLDTATTTTIPVSADNIVLKNFIITANFADIVAAFTLAAAKNFVVDGCYIKATATNMNFTYLFDTNTTSNSADGLTFTNSVWIEPDAATVSIFKVDGINDRWVVKDNYVNLSAVQSTGGAGFKIATGKYLTNIQCEGNRWIMLGGDLSGAGVVFTTDSSSNTGHFTRNYIQHTDTAAEIFGTANSGFSFFENRMTGVAGATGYVLPTVDS